MGAAGLCPWSSCCMADCRTALACAVSWASTRLPNARASLRSILTAWAAAGTMDAGPAAAAPMMCDFSPAEAQPRAARPRGSRPGVRGRGIEWRHDDAAAGLRGTRAFAGFASIIANMPERVIDRCAPDRPAPMMIINGTDDRLVPYDGGGVGFRGRRGFVVSTYETVEFWRAHNRCEERPGRRVMPDRDPDDGSRVTMFYSTDCARAPVILLRVEAAGTACPARRSRNRVPIGSGRRTTISRRPRSSRASLPVSTGPVNGPER